MSKYRYDIAPGEYRYEVCATIDGESYTLGSGTLTIDGQNSEFVLMCVNVATILSPLDRDQFEINLTHQDGRSFGSSKGGYYYYVPAYGGDSYYALEFVPKNSEKYATQKAHFYVYPSEKLGTFFALNLSDQHVYQLVERKDFTIRAPKDMEVYYVDQIRFYMARDYFPLEKEREDDEYAYYKADHLGTLMLRQEGRVTRYYELSENNTNQVDGGTWSEDGTMLTLRELTSDSKQTNRGKYEANLMTNTDYSRTLALTSGDYFDLVPLRGWQAVKNVTGNQHFDPDFHYTVLGDSVTVERTEDDLTGQFGRIQTRKPGVSLVLFSYDAMEYTNTTNSDGHGFHCYSALWPENTGVQIVAVDQPETGIETGIDLSCLDTLYYLSETTDELGNTIPGDSYYRYTFTPSSSRNETIRIRVHAPYMIENGQLNYTDQDWQNDGHWTEYAPNEDGSFTINLPEGRNIVEISTDSGAEYRVLNAHAVQFTLSNDTLPNQPLAVGHTAKLRLDGLQMAVYKLGAIFNPSGGAQFDYNGMKLVFNGGYNINNGAECELYLDEAGTINLVDGRFVAPTYTLANSVLGSLQQLCRNSRGQSEYSGQDSPQVNIQSSVFPILSFSVEDNSNLDELEKRKAGELSVLKYRTVEISKPHQSITITDTSNLELYITAIPKQDIAKMYWRLFQVGNAAPSAWNVLPNNTQTTLLPVDQLFYMNGPAAFLQILIIPEIGYPYTYSVNIVDNANLATLISNIRISATPGHGTMGIFDGELQADSVNCACGEEPITDLGYGFIGGETRFSTSVPNDVDQITIDLISMADHEREIAESSYNISKKKYARTIKVYRVNDTENTLLGYGEVINLDEGENTFLVEEIGEVGANYVYDRSATYRYTITVTRRAPDKTVTFAIPDGASVLVEQNGKAVSPNDDGTYTLADGDYIYHISKPGYLTKTEDFTVEGTEAEITVEVAELEPVPTQSGSVTVRIAGQDAVIRPEKTVEISDDPLDLATQRYVKYNHGGYTVLHALIDACEPVPFTCRNGSFVPEIAIDETGVGPNAGWVCRVNGEICPDPANTLVKNGDRIDFYYDSDYTGMLYARFAEEAVSVTEGSSATLTLAVGGDPEMPIAGADIYFGETKVGTTDSAGRITVPAELLPEKRSYFVTAESKNDDGQNILTCAAAIITVEKDENKEPANPGYTTVSFRLIGDTKHGDETQYHAYSTWIGTTAYAFESEKVSVGDVFQRALTEAGLTFVGLNKNYIESIVGPDGDILEEFSNGKNSGWMFTVNGIHSGQGLNNIYVTDGDEIVWHYVDDYVQETMDNFEGTSGNTATWSTWLDAVDGPSINAGVIVAINGAEIALENNAFTATLPSGSAYPTAAEIKVTPEDKAATVSVLTGPETDEEGETWTFSATAENGKTVNYTLKVMVGRLTEVPEEDITNSTCGTAEIVEAPVTYDKAGKATAVITVKSEQPCVVVVKNPDGTYARLTPEKIDDTTYAFPQADYDPAMEFTVAVKGDYNGDGEFEIVDLAAANKDLLNEEPIDPVKALIMGADSADELEARNLAILNRAWLNEDTTW